MKKYKGPPKPLPTQKYKGPPKPLPTHIEIVSDKAERIIFLLFAIFMAVYLYVE